jgi:hypothetical protein
MMNLRYGWQGVKAITTSTLKKKFLHAQVLNTKERGVKFKKNVII